MLNGVSDNPYRGHRFPSEVISECVWHYFRFGVSFRDVEEMMAARGVVVSYETIRHWCDKFGKRHADGLRRRRARIGDNGISTRSQDQWRHSLPLASRRSERVVLDILVQPKRARFAAIRFFRKLLRAAGARGASLLRINCGVTGRRNESSCLASRIDSIAT
jgi:putative transposase